MTASEAIELLEQCGLNIVKPQHDEVLNIVVKALEKQIPKKTTEREYVPNGRLVYGCCPNCSYFTKNHFKYCAKCGQALDWSDTE